MEIKSRSVELKKASQSKKNSNHSQSQSNGKESSRKRSEHNHCGQHRVTQKKSVMHLSLNISAENVAKMGM